MNKQEQVRLIKESDLAKIGIYLQNEIEELKNKQNRIQNIFNSIYMSPIAAKKSDNGKDKKNKNEDENLNEKFEDILNKEK